MKGERWGSGVGRHLLNLNNHEVEIVLDRIGPGQGSVLVLPERSWKKKDETKPRLEPEE